MVAPLIVVSNSKDKGALPLTRLGFRARFKAGCGLTFTSCLLTLLPVLVFCLVYRGRVLGKIIGKTIGWWGMGSDRTEASDGTSLTSLG